jgi:hypothetical protein
MIVLFLFLEERISAFHKFSMVLPIDFQHKAFMYLDTFSYGFNAKYPPKSLTD